MSQIAIFFVCAACGITSGVVYDFFYCLRAAVRAFAPAHKKALWATTLACDMAFFVALAAFFLYVSHVLDFYALRAYMIFALAAGLLIYLKSLHIIVAFSVNKVYNKLYIKFSSKGERACRSKKSAKGSSPRSRSRA